MTGELIVLLDGQIIGRLYRRAQGKLSFAYDAAWREAEDAYPLSLSMPLAAAEHGPAMESFIWGLLPDNETVLDRWARKFQVSARNAFALISHVGEDCAGAVQFVRPERLDEVQSGATDGIEWLTDADIADRLRILREDHAAWRLARDTGQFSLAGAQPKTALLLDKGRWGIPSGRIPTTHILKPPTGHFEGHAENEHICLSLARALGIPSARSQVMRFGDEITIVVERYDRVLFGNEIRRVHQEDMCQALGVSPTRKYENEGGPGITAITALLTTHSSARAEDLETFLDAVAFNWLIAGSDAHAKNYSVLLSAGPRVRLAPLYDMASILPYEGIPLPKVKLAMKVGGEYRLRDIGARQWRKLAQNIRVDQDQLIARIANLAVRLPDLVTDVCSDALRDGLDPPMVEQLRAQLIVRAQFCLDAIRTNTGE